jgi:hypothetical protein
MVVLNLHDSLHSGQRVFHAVVQLPNQQPLLLLGFLLLSEIHKHAGAVWPFSNRLNISNRPALA